jgi:hypothetical protein
MKSALASAPLLIAVACANPVEIEGDVLIVDPSAFGGNDAGVPSAGGSSGVAGAGGASPSAGAGGIGGAGTGFASGGPSAGSAMPAAAEMSVFPMNAGASGGGLGGAASLGGAGGVATGAGGVATGAGGVPDGAAEAPPAAAGGAASAETVGTSVFDARACDFQNTVGCEDLSCLEACPANDSGSCSTRCQALITCVSTDPQCTITPEDPLCAARVGGAVAACTEEADSAGGANATQTTQPAFVARQFVQCICSVPRP